MADSHGQLVDIDEGKSLLPQIVEKEHELQQKLADARTEADKIVKAAEAARDEAIEKAQAEIPAKEDAYVAEQLKGFEGELKDFEKSEADRLAALKKASEKNLDAAAAAIVDIVLATGE